MKKGQSNDSEYHSSSARRAMFVALMWSGLWCLVYLVRAASRFYFLRKLAALCGMAEAEVRGASYRLWSGTQMSTFTGCELAAGRAHKEMLSVVFTALWFGALTALSCVAMVRLERLSRAVKRSLQHLEGAATQGRKAVLIVLIAAIVSFTSALLQFGSVLWRLHNVGDTCGMTYSQMRTASLNLWESTEDATFTRCEIMAGRDYYQMVTARRIALWFGPVVFAAYLASRGSKRFFDAESKT